MSGAARRSTGLARALSPLLPRAPGVVAFVGAGGKTSALLVLARELEAEGRAVLLTATTHLADPDRVPWPLSRRIVMRPELEVPRAAGAEPAGPVPDGVVVVSRAADEPGKLKGIDPSWVPALARAVDLVLVEADGSRQLPMKAPAPHEPALPPGADLVVGVVGLDGLGRPMDERTVHRPERFASVTGCAPGAPIRWEHLAALVRHPEGLFKDVTGRRALLLNKADVAVCLPSASQLRELAADLVLLTALADPSRPACRSDGEEPGCP